MPNRRLPAAAAFFAAALTAFAVLLWGLQVTSGAAYYAKSQRSIAQVETVPAARGKLLDRNGTILAQDQVTWSAVLAEDVEDQVVRRLKTLCQEEDVAWEGTGPIAGVTPRLLARVKEEGLAGVSFTPAVQRVGSGTLAPHVLGRVGQMSPEEWEVYQDRGYAMDETVGKDGAEGAFESYLHGTPGQKVLETDKDGRITGETNAVQPQAGRDVTLTLDRDLQAAAETALAGFLDRHPQATGGALVALDVRDGGVLAMVSQPGYDAASFSADYAALSQDEAHPLMNRAVQGLYAPGSTFKLVTAAAALVYGDNVFEKDGIRRDRTGDGEKTRCLCGKRGIFNRDGPAMGPQIIRQLERGASRRSASFFHALASPGRPRNGGGASGAYQPAEGRKALIQGRFRAQEGPLGPSRKSQQQTKRTGFAALEDSIADEAPEGKRAKRANRALNRAGINSRGQKQGFGGADRRAGRVTSR